MKSKNWLNCRSADFHSHTCFTSDFTDSFMCFIHCEVQFNGMGTWNVIEDFISLSLLLRCRAIAARFLVEGNGDSQHTIHAMGHCHVDSGSL